MKTVTHTRDTKLKLVDRRQHDGYQRAGSGGVKAEGGQMCGEGRRPDWAWWAHSAVYGGRVTEMYTQHLYHLINQCHLSKSNLKMEKLITSHIKLIYLILN